MGKAYLRNIFCYFATARTFQIEMSASSSHPRFGPRRWRASKKSLKTKKLSKLVWRWARARPLSKNFLIVIKIENLTVSVSGEKFSFFEKNRSLQKSLPASKKVESQKNFVLLNSDPSCSCTKTRELRSDSNSCRHGRLPLCLEEALPKTPSSLLR